MYTRMSGRPLLSLVFGESNKLKIIDFFLMGKEYDFTLSHISFGTGLSRTAVRNGISDLVKKKVVVMSRKDKKSVYYRINRENIKYQIINDLYSKLVSENLS